MNSRSLTDSPLNVLSSEVQALFAKRIRWIPPEMNEMDPALQTMASRIARAATACQQERTGHEPKSVSVVLTGDTLVVTLHGALSLAEQAMAQSAEGAAKVQEFHRQLFRNGSDPLREKIKEITGMDVREASAEVEPKSGAVAQVFNGGTMVQVFLLSGKVPAGTYDTEATVASNSKGLTAAT